MFESWNTHNRGLICQITRADRGRTHRVSLTTRNTGAKRKRYFIITVRGGPRVQLSYDPLPDF